MTPVHASAQQAISSDQALRIARLDAERVYRDLGQFRIQIVQENDGWHVDYLLKDARLHGGGPRYIIDSTTGQISWRSYEQ